MDKCWKVTSENLYTLVRQTDNTGINIFINKFVLIGRLYDLVFYSG